MPISTCDISNWTNNPQFQVPSIGAKKLKALQVYVLAQELKNLSGTDYSNPTTLALAAKSLQPLSGNRLDAALLGIYISKANAVTASSVSTSASTLLSKAVKFTAQSDQTLDQELLFLLCQIAAIT